MQTVEILFHSKTPLYALVYRSAKNIFINGKYSKQLHYEDKLYAASIWFQCHVTLSCSHSFQFQQQTDSMFSHT